jgi:FAD:protein FMN transferase
MRLLRVFLVICVFLSFSSCSAPAADAHSELVLGTVCTVNAFHDGSKSLYEKLFSRLRKIDADFSVNRIDSQVSKINAGAGRYSVQVSDDVYLVIKQALYYADLSEGAFDPTIGPLVKLWGINTDHARVPAKVEITEILPLVNWRDVEMNDSLHSVYLKKAGMSLDLGGIAKGYAADELVRILFAHKIKRAVIDLGGNIYVFGTKKDGSLWRVGIKDPENDTGDPALALSLKNSTIVTSGVYERFFIENGVRYHHILDPKTGYPADTGLLSSTVVCESSIAADALSTTVFVLGKDRGFALLSALDAQKSAGDELYDVPHAVFITTDHQIFASAVLEKSLFLINNSYQKVIYQ